MDKEMTLEEAFVELDEMIKKLEDRSITLEDSFQEYDKGMKLLKYCNDKIDKVEKKILIINEDGETHEF
ncbi:exodeoxyribonuclease VII small subunit [Anaerobium acetethylicum]|uniref:Exodeoxyribonuclease 7 small subunit n=1 Tax=Anaerobium acetethylicum TaxID=1619234 RepID=A0A1D3TNK4_9FIRM|nr:exodeoxyribonuclease VII small subunit [Anaerobium acetethylicum]SCP94893.1 exodeoxyribonuclease VII small subunit [Anaerobium acetethylicum]